MELRAFTDEELSFIKNMRRSEIRVTHDGRLEIYFRISDEYAAKRLHDFIMDEFAIKQLFATSQPPA